MTRTLPIAAALLGFALVTGTAAPAASAAPVLTHAVLTQPASAAAPAVQNVGVKFKKFSNRGFRRGGFRRRGFGVRKFGFSRFGGSKFIGTSRGFGGVGVGKKFVAPGVVIVK